MIITMTKEQYDAIRRLADFAGWYIDQNKGKSSEEMHKEWESDKEDVEAGFKVLTELGQQIYSGGLK
jgi:hypothetical protein